MTRLIIAASAIALLAGASVANAQNTHRNGYYNSHGRFIERNVRMPFERDVPPPNADLKYGPYPEYPQSPPGGGY